MVAADDQTFIQKSNPDFLNPGEVAYNYGSTQFLDMYGMTGNSALTTQPATGQNATAVAADSNGYLDFSSFGGTTNEVVWADTWVWVPSPSGCGYEDNNSAAFSSSYTYGPFRAEPFMPTPVDDQANPYRLWINGTEVGQIWNTQTNSEQDLPHPDTRSFNPFSSASNPIEDTWDSMALNIGWNHLVFQFDTSVAYRYRPTSQGGTGTAQTLTGWETPYWQQPLDFKFTLGGCNYVSGVYSQAAEPANLNVGPSGNPTYTGYISAYNILGTFAATTADNGLYVRPTASQSANLNPNSVMTELANRDSTFATTWNNGTGNYVELRRI